MCEKLSESQIIPSTPTPRAPSQPKVSPRRGMPNPALLFKSDFAAKQTEAEAVVNGAAGSPPSAWEHHTRIVESFTRALHVFLSLTKQVNNVYSLRNLTLRHCEKKMIPNTSRGERDVPFLIHLLQCSCSISLKMVSSLHPTFLSRLFLGHWKMKTRAIWW